MNNRTTTEFLNGLKNQNIRKSDFKNIIRSSSVRCIEIVIHDKYTIVELEFNEKHFHGLAVCSYSDRNSARTGMAIAYHRAFVNMEKYILEEIIVPGFPLRDLGRCKCYIDPAKNELEKLIICFI